jgi:hypothetical protein
VALLGNPDRDELGGRWSGRRDRRQTNRHDPRKGTRPHEHGAGLRKAGMRPTRRGLRPIVFWSLEAADEPGPGLHAPAPGEDIAYKAVSRWPVSNSRPGGARRRNCLPATAFDQLNLGRTTTYGADAISSGSPGDGEPVGQILDGVVRRSPLVGPTHRVGREGSARRETVAGPEWSPSASRPRTGGPNTTVAITEAQTGKGLMV